MGIKATEDVCHLSPADSHFTVTAVGGVKYKDGVKDRGGFELSKHQLTEEYFQWRKVGKVKGQLTWTHVERKVKNQLIFVN